MVRVPAIFLVKIREHKLSKVLCQGIEFKNLSDIIKVKS